MSAAIQIRNISKAFKIRHESAPRYITLRESLLGALRRKDNRFTSEIFWALKDVSFDVPQGEVLGVIGRNGAGKSTLLKILSRITEPTEGYADIKGRVGSLLEVGTGFHPELTGRENIYLNGTLLGMRKRQIDRIFDEIVAFSEVEKFLDTPVKRYSSGMYVRLAFAVAAHMEPDVLIIDEVLAVGDMQFQKKCLGKMKDVSGHGRTVIFVSHGMTTVNSLCSRCVLLNNGRVEAEGPTSEVTNKYYQTTLGAKSGSQLDFKDSPPGDEVARLYTARLIDANRQPISFVQIDQPFGIEIQMEVRGNQPKVIPNFHFYTQGVCAFASSPAEGPITTVGIHIVTMWIPGNFLNDCLYEVRLAATTLSPQTVHFHEQNSFFFSVVDDLHSGLRHGYANAVPGTLRPLMKWESKRAGMA